MKLAVLVPVRGPALYLAEALDSVLSQDPRPDVVVVIDDGSSPGIALHADHAPHVRLVRRESSGGPAAARAAGLAAAGEVDLVALCDADDAWAPGKLATQLAALADEPGAALCFGSAEIVGVDDRPTGERWESIPAGVHTARELAPRLYERNPIPTSSVVLRAEALAAAGGFETTLALAEDWDLWLRLLARGESFLSVPQARIRYRRHPGGLTADVAVLAECQLALHVRHAGLVDHQTGRSCRAADLVALARGRARRREWPAARDALRAAARLRPLGAGERALRAALAVPGVRGLLGRRAPYRRD